jgi:hypothetical protein
MARAVPFLATLIFADVFVTTADLAWTRPAVTVPKPPYLPQSDARGARVMRLEEVSHARLALNESAFSEEQLRHAMLLSPMTNLPQHTAVLDPYGLYLADVARAMADLAEAAPVVLAEATSADILLAPLSPPGEWLARAVDQGRLRPTHSMSAGALAMRVQYRLPRSFLATSADMVPRAEIPMRLAKSLDRVLITHGKAIVSGHASSFDPSLMPAQILAATRSERIPLSPTSWRPGAASYAVDTTQPSLLVEIEAFMPGWRAFVDGREQPILQANVFGRAVVIPTGKHTVTWTFAPPVLVAAVWASWLAILVASLTLLVGTLLASGRAVGARLP